MANIPQAEARSVSNAGLSYLRPLHKEMARRLILGQKVKAIAEALGMSTSRTSIIMNSPLFKMYLNKMEEERNKGVYNIQKTFQEISPVALEVMERTMYTARAESLRFKAAESILDRAGHGAVNKSQIQVQAEVNVKNHTREELMELVKQRLSKMNLEGFTEQKLKEDAQQFQITFDEVPDEIAECTLDSVADVEFDKDNDCSGVEQQPRTITVDEQTIKIRPSNYNESQSAE